MISAVIMVLVQCSSPVHASGHCVDKKRGLIMDSCEDLSKFRRQSQALWTTQETTVVKRENNPMDVEALFGVESLPHDGE